MLRGQGENPPEDTHSDGVRTSDPALHVPCLVSLEDPRGTAVFIEFQDLAGITIFSVVLSLLLALLGAVPFTMPLMLFLLLVATVICGNMK